jgi:hypothetical protein
LSGKNYLAKADRVFIGASYQKGDEHISFLILVNARVYPGRPLLKRFFKANITGYIIFVS